MDPQMYHLHLMLVVGVCFNRFVDPVVYSATDFEVADG